jgi:hypothetical protein
LTATTIVETLIRIAPTAGGRTVIVRSIAASTSPTPLHTRNVIAAAVTAT